MRGVEQCRGGNAAGSARHSPREAAGTPAYMIWPRICRQLEQRARFSWPNTLMQRRHAMRPQSQQYPLMPSGRPPGVPQTEQSDWELSRGGDRCGANLRDIVLPKNNCRCEKILAVGERRAASCNPEPMWQRGEANSCHVHECIGNGKAEAYESRNRGGGD